MKTIKDKLHLILVGMGLILYILAFTIGAFGQTITYNSKKITYSKLGDIVVTVNDANKTQIPFKKRTSMPTAAEVLVEYKKILSSTPIVIPPIVVPPATSFIEIGNGSGWLTIDGSKLGLTGINQIKIKAGTYSGIDIKNFNQSQRINIVNKGIVNITENVITENINNLSISGSGEPSIKYGFSFKNNRVRAIKMYGKMNNITIEKMSFVNVGDWCIAGENSNGKDFAYKGTAETRNENFKILYCYFENCGTIAFGGTVKVNDGEDSGFYKGVEIANNIFINSDYMGSAVSFSNVQDYDVHDNIVDNVNAKTDTHNGIFSMQGNGKFYNNKLTNFQGNAIRMWLYSRGKEPATNEIYNNIVFNTRKYSAFELQGFSSHLWAGKTTFANARIFNNTVGRMNTSKDWEGQILDLYNYDGALEYYNNLGFELNRVGKQTTDMINGNGDSKPPRPSETELIKTNKYFQNWQDAVADLTSLKSKIAGVGAQ